ncbi:hypothetical protein TEA_026963 [Camellia sinensis var. sinensis]|uniref:PPM-type phosphatase domain-containing protein n=1 Tax=Camellia sinensis var. sinensis TaxID=542762 RepID=A0A4S4F213_CAMSN|nr:hypothetical protein TEA_026963 [Camellia sinensis var. sinensis]
MLVTLNVLSNILPDVSYGCGTHMRPTWYGSHTHHLFTFETSIEQYPHLLPPASKVKTYDIFASSQNRKIKACDVPRVNGQLAVSRAFGDKSLKSHLRSDPDIQDTIIDFNTDVLILASDGLWKVMENQEAVDIARRMRDPRKAAKQLITEALERDSEDDISCIVVRFRG